MHRKNFLYYFEIYNAKKKLNTSGFVTFRLVTTNAARFRLAAGPDKRLLEFGLRRAQGPDGGLSGSKYCYIGGLYG